MNVNLIPLPYLVVISASVFLLTDYSNSQEMCSGIRLAGSLPHSVWHFEVHFCSCLSPISIRFEGFSMNHDFKQKKNVSTKKRKEVVYQLPLHRTLKRKVRSEGSLLNLLLNARTYVFLK